MSFFDQTPALTGTTPLTRGGPPGDRQWMGLLFLGTLGFYAALTSFGFASGAGGVEIALGQRGEWLFRPQHLLGTALLRMLLGLGGTLGASAVATTHAVNITLAAAAVALLFQLLRGLGLARPLAGLAALVLAASNGLVQHATSGEAVVMALPVSLLALALLVPVAPPAATAEPATAEPATAEPAPRWWFWRRPLLASALFFLSVALSAQQLLLLPALIALLLRRAPAGRRGIMLAFAAGATLVLGVGPFLLAALGQGHGSPRQIAAWLLARPDGQALAALTGGPLQLPRALAGIGRLIFAASDGESAVRALLTGEGPAAGAASALISDGPGLLRNLLASLVLLALAGRGLWRLRQPTLVLALGAPLLLAGGLGLRWLSSDPTVWLPVFPLLLALAAFGLRGLRFTASARGTALATLTAGGLAVVLVLALGAANRCRQAPSLLCPAGGPEWRAAVRLAAVTGDGDLMLAPTGSDLLWLPHVRPGARVLQLDQAIPQSVDAVDYLGEIWSAVEETFARGGRVYIQGLCEAAPARLTGAWPSIESKHGVSRAQLRRLLEREFRRRLAPEVGPAVEELLPRQVVGQAMDASSNPG